MVVVLVGGTLFVMSRFGEPLAAEHPSYESVAVNPAPASFSVRVGQQTYTAIQQPGFWVALSAPSQKAQKLHVPLDLLVKVVTALAPEETMNAVLDLPLRTILRKFGNGC